LRAVPDLLVRHPVLELLARRAGRAERAGAVTDGARLALAIEGGGMRGVVSAGMAAAIELLGLTACFDLVVGTSAGALNGAGLLAGVADACCTAYHSVFTTRRFINPYRLLMGRAAIDVAFALDHTDETLDAARHERTAASAIPLHCVAVDVDQAAPARLSALHCVEELRAALLASSRMPWVGGPPVPFRGRRFLDGGLAESIPYRTAVALGATHVLVLQTRPHGTGVEPVASLADRVITRQLRALNAALPDLYQRRTVEYDDAVAELAAATDAPQAEGPFLYGLRLPAGSLVVGRFERYARALEVAGRAAREHAERVLGGAAASGRTDASHPRGGAKMNANERCDGASDLRGAVER
jgi:predicted patatin/cPLA2 family phospholipase